MGDETSERVNTQRLCTALRNTLQPLRPGYKSFRAALPRLGSPGSRSSELHDGRGNRSELAASQREWRRFYLLRLLGAIGTLLIGLGGLGGGALPVVGNPWFDMPGGSLLGQMMQASSALVLIGVGLLVSAWLLMAPFVGAGNEQSRVRAATMLRTYLVWVAPLMATAPLFTQDIYSYLAQGSIVRQGFDPYAAGPIEFLGTEHPLARSVPFIWAHSPSPYGPVALCIAAAISALTHDSIFLGVLAHRTVSLAGVLAASWATVALARRCGVASSAALWLGVCNPLAILHLIAGIHNEALMLGFMMVGLELAFRGLDGIRQHALRGWMLFTVSAILLACGGLVKVTGFVALGFTGMALARQLRHHPGCAVSPGTALAIATALQTTVLVATAAVVSVATGIGFGWVTGQGGAAQIRSWLSVTTDIGVISGYLAMTLGLGDHIDAMLVITRAAGLLLAFAFMGRMLWATYTGSIHPLGGLGVSTLLLVVLFPVVHPWYPLWGIIPLAAWANRFGFRAGVATYSAAFSFLVLPRGLALPSGTVFTIYGSAAAGFGLLAASGWLWYRARHRRRDRLTNHG